MSKRFRIVKRISKEDTGHFEDIEVDDDFVDNEMVQIIADNEYDPLYDDCESIAVALQLAGYGKVADLEAKLKALQNGIIDDETLNMLVKEHKLYKDLEAKLAESEKQIKDAREAGNVAVDSWCKNRRKYEAQIAEMQNKSFILYSMLYETLEKQGCDNVASQIDQMTGWTYDKETDWLKGNRNYNQLKQQLAEKEKEIDILKTALGQASVEAFGKKESFVSSNYPKKIANANEYMEFLIYIASKEKENGNKK